MDLNPHPRRYFIGWDENFFIPSHRLGGKYIMRENLRCIKKPYKEAVKNGVLRQAVICHDTKKKICFGGDGV